MITILIKKRGLLFVGIMLTFTLQLSAQVDTIKLNANRLLTNFSKPGLRQYLVYTQIPGNKKQLNLSLWLRETKRGMHNGQPVFITNQHWYGTDSTRYRTVYSLNRITDFGPIYHQETIGGVTKAYNWSDKKIKGADTVANNMDKAFDLEQTQPSFNWNLDMETFEQLPLSAGKVFAINFYDAGKNPPRYVVYQVNGEETIALLDGQKVLCWKLVTTRSTPNGVSSQTFWISKKNHEFLKEEDDLNGTFRYKIKLPSNSPNLLLNFISGATHN
jgi:hypothetical protein